MGDPFAAFFQVDDRAGCEPGAESIAGGESFPDGSDWSGNRRFENQRTQAWPSADDLNQ